MDSTESETPQPDFPRRMFAIGNEPVGIRVTPYHKPSCITQIVGALKEEEIAFIRSSPFGKLLEINEKPSFSGRFGRFLISRMLKTEKKHEIWFLFAGKPVRFSLREFFLVTGLNCRRFPKRTKKRSSKNITEKPYWGELFGTMREIPVSYVVTMLKKKTVTDRDIRIKYALLALLSAVLLPTSHNPRILESYAEKIKDLDEFLAYPWGRVSFQMLISSIKERNEVSLSQNTIAFKGFVLSIQLVMIEAVPSLMGVVRDGDSSGSEGESSDGGEDCDDDTEGKKTINTVNVRVIDTACKASVTSIILPEVDENNADPELGWSDDEDDGQVQNLVKSIEEGFPFSNSHFKGGATKADVIRMREEALKENNSRKTARGNSKQPVTDSIDADYVASIVKNSVSVELKTMSEQIKDLSKAFNQSQTILRDNVKDALGHFLRDVGKLISTPCNRPHVQPAPQPHPSNTACGGQQSAENQTLDADNIIDEAMFFANNVTAQPQNDTFCEFGDGDATRASPLKPADVGEDVDTRSQENEPADGDDVSRNADGGVESVVLPNLSTPNNQPSATVDHVDTNLESQMVDNDTPGKHDTLADGLSFPDPSFSIGLTQMNNPDGNVVDHVVQSVNAPVLDTVNDAPVGNRKSKRAKIVPRALIGDYQCDKRVLTRAWEAYVNAVCSTPSCEVADKFKLLSEKIEASFVIDFGSLTLDSSEMSTFVDRSTHLSAKVVDVLIQHTRALFLSNPEHIQSKNSVFLDTKFVSLLTKSFPKFTKASKKDRFRFQAALCDFVCGDYTVDEVSRFYFPFNFDKQHWVGLCVDCSSSQLIILNCYASRMTEKVIAEELRPISQMFPYLLRQAGKQLCAKDMKPLTIERPRNVHQNNNHFESGITSVLLIQAHAVGGVDVCKCITPDILDAEVQRTAVMIYEENMGAL